MISLADQFRLGHSTVCGIINDTLIALYENLSDEVLKLPKKKDFEDTAEGFWQLWNFPHCIGPIDGKHISIVV